MKGIDEDGGFGSALASPAGLFTLEPTSEAADQGEYGAVGALEAPLLPGGASGSGSAGASRLLPAAAECKR
jgi:hypothetical protein